MGDPHVQGVLASTRKNLDRYRKRRMNEQDTKASLIEPVLEALGWDTRDPDVVRREFRPKGCDDPVDYALQIDHKPRVLVEAKALGESLDDRKFIKQTLGYAVMAGVPWCALTDGDRWVLFNAAAQLDADAKMFWQFNVSSEGAGSGAMGFLARTVVESGVLDASWSGHIADRQVRAALARIVTGPDTALVGLIAKMCPAVAIPDVAASLKRLAVTIESPLPDPAMSATSLPMDGRGPGLRELLAAGVLRAPLKLVGTYKGRSVEGLVNADGEIEVSGQTYASPSTAGRAAVKAAGGPERQSVNGWDFWRVAEGANSGKTLSDIRRS